MKQIFIVLLILTLNEPSFAQWKRIADFYGTDGTVTGNELISCVYFIDLPGPPKIGFVGTFSDLYKTMDGGQTWKSVWDSNWSFSDFYVTDVFFKDSLTGWFTVYNDTFPCFRTTDGGETWKPLNIPGSHGIGEEVYYTDASNLLFVTMPLRPMMYSSDLGDTWNVTSPHWTGGVYSFSPLQIIAQAAYDSCYLFTNNGGVTWDTIFPIFPPNTIPGGEIFAVSGTSSCFIQATTNDTPLIIRSDDFGRSWRVISKLLSKKYYYQRDDSSFLSYRGVIAGDFSRLYIQTDTGMYISVDSGYTWKFDGGPTESLAGCSFYASKGITIAGKTVTNEPVYEGDGLWKEVWPEAAVAEQQPIPAESGPLEVFDLLGRCVYRGASVKQPMLPPGAYLEREGTTIKKVFVP